MGDMSSGKAPDDKVGDADHGAGGAGHDAGDAGHGAGGAGRGAGDGWQGQLNALGGFIRMQRRLADMSLREMAAMTSVSNAYLSQIERGLHQPSLRVLRSIAEALGIAPEDLLRRANILSGDGSASAASPGNDSSPGQEAAPVDTEAAIATDPRLSPSQREALLNVYRSFRDPN
jgi:transcriptional regulator with XRE-family HTH domain